MSDVDENTKNLDKLAEELSDYLNEVNKKQPETKQTEGCGKATVYEDLYDTIKVDPKTLNFELNFLDRSLDMYMINESNEYSILDIVVLINLFNCLSHITTESPILKFI